MHLLAYIDPGAGSLFVQALIGGALAVLYAIKLSWKQLKRGVQVLAAKFKSPPR